MIVAGATAYPRIIDPRAVPRDRRRGRRAVHVRRRPHRRAHRRRAAPQPGRHVADVVTFTTHKTLRGPRGGCILSTAELADAIDKAVFPGLQGGPLEHVIAAKAVAFREAAQPEFSDYAAQIVRNADGARAALAEPGLPARVGRHRQPPDAGRPAHASTPSSPARRPSWPSTGPASASTRTRSPTTRARRSSPAACASARPRSTTQGMREAEMATIAALIARVLAAATTTPRSPPSATRSSRSAASFVPYP